MHIPVKSLGQSGFRLQFDSTVVYTDPYLSNHVAEVEGEEMQRLTPIPIAPSDVKDADFILITHAHMDHCDLKTLVPVSEVSASCRFVCPNEAAEMLVRAGIDKSRLIIANEEWLDLGSNVSVLPIPAAHPEIETDADGYLRCVGYVMDCGDRRLYHSGDGSPNEHVLNKLSRLQPIDVAFIPVNERNYYRDKLGIIGNMSVREAFQMAADIGVRIVVPTHWDMFALNRVYQEELNLLYQLMSPPFEMRLNPEYL